jgi:hypothetical protein
MTATKKKNGSWESKRHRDYKYREKKRGNSYPFSLEQSKALFRLPCYYCTKPQAKGMDRLDNDLGYIDGNIVPCCAICNTILSTLPHLAKLEMREALRSIHEKNLLKDWQPIFMVPAAKKEEEDPKPETVVPPGVGIFYRPPGATDYTPDVPLTEFLPGVVYTPYIPLVKTRLFIDGVEVETDHPPLETFYCSCDSPAEALPGCPVHKDVVLYDIQPSEASLEESEEEPLCSDAPCESCTAEMFESNPSELILSNTQVADEFYWNNVADYIKNLPPRPQDDHDEFSALQSSIIKRADGTRNAFDLIIELRAVYDERDIRSEYLSLLNHGHIAYDKNLKLVQKEKV